MPEANHLPSPAAIARPLDLAALACGKIVDGQAELSRLIGRGCEAAFGTDALLELQFVQLAQDALLESSSDAAPQWHDAIALAGPFGEIECEDGARLLRALTGIEPAAAGSDHAAWLDAAIVGRLAATPFTGTTRLLRDTHAAPDEAIVMQLVLRSPQHAITFHARATASTWLAFLQDSAWEPRRAPRTRFSDVPFAAPVRIARHRLPAHAVRQLAAGDIVVPDRPAFACDGTGQLRLGSALAHVRYDAPTSLYIISAEINLDNYEHDAAHDDFDSEYDYQEEDGAHDDAEGAHDNDGDDDDDDTAEGEDDHDDVDSEDRDGNSEDDHSPAVQQLDRVPVTLDFELGRVALTLGDLRTLGRGSVIEIEGGSPSKITIQANGRTLGLGEIVDVDGRLGIRLTDWRA